MIEKRWPNHVEASIIEASHESDILILGNLEGSVRSRG